MSNGYWNFKTAFKNKNIDNAVEILQCVFTKRQDFDPNGNVLYIWRKNYRSEQIMFVGTVYKYDLQCLTKLFAHQVTSLLFMYIL